MTDTLTFFLGRWHHAEKLVPLANAFAKRNIQIDILITNNSINIDPPTEFLHQYGINAFHHVWDYLVDSRDEIDRLVRLTRGDILNSELVYSVPSFWIIQGLREAAENYIGFQNYLRQRKPSGVFALHEQNFFVKILFNRAWALDIPTFSLQEGIILKREEDDLGKYNTATEYTTRLFSWSEDNRQYYSDADKVVPVGPSHLDYWIAALPQKQQVREHTLLGLKLNPSRKTVVFAPPKLDLYHGDFFRALELLLAWSEQHNHNLIVSFHPFESKPLVKQVRERYTNRFMGAVTYHKINAMPILMSADVVVTQVGTFALEANVFQVPVVELDVDYLGLEQSLSDKMGVYLLEGDEFDLIDKVMDKSEYELILPLADGRSTERIVRNVMEIING